MTTSSFDELKQVVGNGKTVRIDVKRFNESAAGLLNDHLAKAAEASDD